ncbi:MAG: hypothetical protein IKM39_03425 [Clostridia bacterium]|nr:hypothetical protein [Clostridia bacterium]
MIIKVLKTAMWVTMLLFLVGCKGLPDRPVLEQRLHCVVELEKNGVDYRATLTSPLLGNYTFTLLEPESMEGMVIVLQNGAISYGFEGSEYSLEQDADQSLWTTTGGVLEQAVRGGEGILWEMNQQHWVCNGKVDQVGFTAHFNKETNLPVYLETQNGLKVNFIN